ncbi:hypothetical protein [Changpingibacter yushuensis]|uniref:hypothetical protein n=1 Tax=Changpingibacter yushuensis TaxID=2758440 RepID=UPI001CB6E5D7|nr:hypothetical protein [Changpingibacter yushuensis]
MLTPSGGAGYAIDDEDNLVSVFNTGKDGKGLVDTLVQDALEKGALRLDAYDPVLTKMYAKNGFHPVARMRFDDQYAPEGWDFNAVSADEVARRLDSISLAGANSTLLRDCLAASCDNARYWQEPDGTDVLAATDSMMRSLTRVAEHVASSHCTSWWRQPVQRNEQWSTTWEGDFDASPSIDPIGLLRSTRAGIIEEERTAHIERPADPTANWSGDWWSSPAAALTSSTRLLDGTSPANLWFVEDSFGWDHAQTIKVKIPREANIYEIDSADAWASLCKRFPIEVTAQVRHDWYRTTGRSGMWVMPDWLRVAEHYNAVHLQVQAYLCAAGTAIPITEHTASVIAGWNPDQTYWFTPEIAWSGDPVRWERREDDGWYICG